ncbi:two-component system, sensor histidine kinase YesM [Paenibacillus algorifonticola]|uniref:Two-component system, sensor histidine kinase YesM n=1 Tax=Paenibacillus algorifonticola TaxID=684063 RepID=A0A1I2FUQ8_9BACL|nr:sensor histidine kinase [Paenibacillus algorifonticola]SFF08161.1 two-component system, sensor histidine kinase YesM [Paenibacillus algorifonticola]
MRFGQSIKTKLIIGFMGVMLPIVVYMLINNMYAKTIVREKVSETYRNTLDIFGGQMDHNLEEINEYLYQMSVLDSDVGLLTSFPMDSDWYMLTKVQIDSKLNRDVGVYSLLDSIFVYHERDIIFGTDNAVYEDARQIIKQNMVQMTKDEQAQHNDPETWEVKYDERIPGHYFLINFIEVRDGLYVGGIIRVMDLERLLAIQWSDGDIGNNGIYLRDGNQSAQALTEQAPRLLNGQPAAGAEALNSVVDPDTKQSYLVLNRNSSLANIAYRVLVPEQTLLKSLIFFQNAALLAPFGFLLLLGIYLLFMRNMLFKPLRELMLGMKKIAIGQLDVRLAAKQSGQSLEFAFLGNTFNKMAEQIKTLKIDVYEEQLRVKQGELRQLQAQINPHFYMNSLNIVYNLAALGDTESVKKMSLHLADYFRFIMRANRDMILLSEELDHIDNYITIQKMRFPDKLQFTYDVPEFVKNYKVAALTVQPFVENAIIHGFKNRRKPFIIHIGAETQKDGGFYLTITDNGTGFSEPVLEQLQRKIPLTEGETSRLGIMNVIHRLQLIYGERAAITFKNIEEGGAAVTIRFPVGEEELIANV